MALSFNIPKFSAHVPWFMFDLTNKQLITSTLIPGDIKDSKSIVVTETPISGQNYAPVTHGGNGNKKISFTIPLIKRNNTVGNILILKQFELLRNQSLGFLDIFAKQFKPNPKVLFYWGVGTVPLPYFVSKCDFSHKAGWINEMGNPQYSEVSLELVLDESSKLYKAEEVFRKITAVLGQSVNGFDVIASQVTGDKII